MGLKDFMNVLTEKREIDSPEFVKDYHKEPDTVSQLKKLLNEPAEHYNHELIKQDVKLFEIGAAGEANVYYELNNSMLPMLCFHDVCLNTDGHAAQLDFVAVTHSAVYVIETKRLYGDIEVNENGEFIRKIKSKSGKTIKHEGMYSPVTQSERHARILKKMLVEEGLIKRMAVEPVVVLANPKTVINKAAAPAHIQKMIIRADQLVSYLSDRMKVHKKDRFLLDKDIRNIAGYINKKHRTPEMNADKYSIRSERNDRSSLQVREAEPGSGNLHSEELYEALKAFRMKQAKLEKTKPYLVYYNSAIDDIIACRPKTVKELAGIKGFGEVKCQKYGEEIVGIVKKFS